MTGAVDELGHPPARTWRWWVPDVVLALLMLPTSLPFLHRAGLPVTGLTVATIVLGTLPVLVRRIWPLPALAATATINLGAVLVEPRLAPSLAMLVCLYAVACYCPPRQALAAAAALEVAGVLLAIRLQKGDWWYGAIFLTGLVGAALAFGLYAATRRQYLEQLRERARRLELERDQQAELAVAAERARIARELHDIVAHHLTVIVTLGDAMVANPGASPERTAEVMRAVSATGRQALGDTRRLLGVLRDETEDSAASDNSNQSSEDRRPLPDLAGLDDLLARVRAAGLPVTYEVKGRPPDLPTGIQLTAYRLVQEALTNTLKHAGTGASAVVRVGYPPGAVEIEIEDDGTNLPHAAVTSAGGRGLIGMRERVQAFGGELATGPGRRGGWSVVARLPVTEDGA